VNEVVILLIIVLSAAISALLVHDLLEFGQAHAQVMPPPLARASFTISPDRHLKALHELVEVVRHLAVAS
jgi:hypothetical protein